MSVSGKKFLDPETNIMDQFLDPKTDIMGEGNYIELSLVKNIDYYLGLSWTNPRSNKDMALLQFVFGALNE